MAQVYKDPVQAYIMPRNQALNVQMHIQGSPVLDVSDGEAALLSMLDLCEKRGIELKAWIPELLVDMNPDQRPKQWTPSAVRKLIADNPEKTYGIVVFRSSFGPTLAVLASSGITAKTEVVQI